MGYHVKNMKSEHGAHSTENVHFINRLYIFSERCCFHVLTWCCVYKVALLCAKCCACLDFNQSSNGCKCKKASTIPHLPLLNYLNTRQRAGKLCGQESEKQEEIDLVSSTLRQNIWPNRQQESKNIKKKYWPCYRIFRNILIKSNNTWPGLWAKLLHGTKTGTGLPKHLESNFRPI